MSIRDEILHANIRGKLCFTIPTTINTPEEWANAIEVSAKAIMETIQKHNKEAV